MHITLATYNIHSCIGTDGRFDPARIAQVLNEIRADVLALQEVEHHSVENLDLLEYLAGEVGLNPIAGSTLRRETRGYGNALLTRLPILTVTKVDLSVSGREPRGALDVILNCNGRNVRIVATHLGLSPGERRRQVRRLLALFESSSPDFSVLMGDLNEWFLWGRVLRWLRAYFKRTPDYATFPTRFPLFALDHIWVNPRSRLVQLGVHKSELARIASDHFPLKGVIEIS